MADPVKRLIRALNRTEVRQLLREHGQAYDCYTDDNVHDLLGRILERGEPEPVLSLLETHRHAIKTWATENWDIVGYQIECPLNGGLGCTTCPDYTVVSCLMYNRHIFNTERTHETMSDMSWNSLILALCKSDKDHGAELLRKYATQNYVDAYPTRLALIKIAAIVQDMRSGSDVKGPLVYMGLSPKDIPDEVAAVARDKGLTPKDVLLRLAEQLLSPPVKAESKTKKKAKAVEPEPEPAPEPAPNPDLDDDDDDDDETEPPKSEYFAGIRDARKVTGGTPQVNDSGDDDDDDDDDAKEKEPEQDDRKPLPPHQSVKAFLKAKMTQKTEEPDPSKVDSEVPTLRGTLDELAKAPCHAPRVTNPHGVPEVPYTMIREAVREELIYFLDKMIGSLRYVVASYTADTPVSRVISVKVPEVRPEMSGDIPDLVDDDDDD